MKRKSGRVVTSKERLRRRLEEDGKNKEGLDVVVDLEDGVRTRADDSESEDTSTVNLTGVGRTLVDGSESVGRTLVEISESEGTSNMLEDLENEDTSNMLEDLENEDTSSVVGDLESDTMSDAVETLDNEGMLTVVEDVTGGGRTLPEDLDGETLLNDDRDVLATDDGVDNNRDLLTWYIWKNKNMSMNRKLVYLCALRYVGPLEIPTVTFNLDGYTDANAEMEFRFNVAAVHELFELFQIPEVVVTDGRDSLPGVEALCIMLSRLAFPKRYFDMMKTFGRSVPAMSRIFLHMIDFVHDKFADTIFSAQALLSSRMQAYCDAVYNKGAPMDTIFGFLDETKVGIARPAPRRGQRGENLQRQVFSGHKRHHCFNYQAVTAPDGMCVHFWGPMEGRRHDSAMLHASKLLKHFDEHPNIFSGRALYGDPAYGVQQYIVSGYKGNVSDPIERAFNQEMSSVRESVEWNFKMLKTLWPYIDFKKQQKARLSPVGKFVKVAMLLTNCHNCYSPNQISSYFGMAPPSMRDYLS